ncbi:MAG: LysM peptidoglycan-binding domain-containing protein, partial [Muribaculaceae bacterium]|nr:LysM peptidoglycan-binding domain-containing protein [Muribaculaceae bacterium]
TVASGENLTVIAKKNGVTVSELKTANPKINPDMLHPGDKITIPAAKKSKK